MRPFLVSALLCLLVPGSVLGEWNVVSIGQCLTNWLEEVEIGDGRNDGYDRIYVVSAYGAVYEWTYLEGTWNREFVTYDGSPYVYYDLSICDGRNDGVNRVYVGNADFVYGEVYECSFEDTAWTKEAVQAQEGEVLCTRVGDGRNDGVNRVYAGIADLGDPGLIEYTWTGTEWERYVIDGQVVSGSFVIADGRNDGVNRIYMPDRRGPLYEFSWNGSSFDRVTIGVTPIWLVAADVGPGRNDGVNRIYTGVENGHLFEVTYNDGTWESNDMTPSGPSNSHYGIRVARLRADGIYRVYATTQFNHLFEYTWTGIEFVDSVVVDATTGATACLTVGTGRNDDTMRIYVSDCWGGHVYEATHTDPFITRICGDSDGNAEVTSSDGFEILNCFGSGVTLSSCWSANVNGDDLLTPSDGFHLLNYLGDGPDLDCAPCELARGIHSNE
jgi:hypothetical protein